MNRIFKLNISVLLLSFAFSGACFGEYLDGDSILDSAETLKERGEHDQAVKVLSDGLVALQKSNPTVENHKITQVFYSEIPLYMELAQLHIDKKEFDKAYLVLTRGIQRNSGSAEILSMYLNLLVENGERQSAIDTQKRQCGSYFISGKVCKNAL